MPSAKSKRAQSKRYYQQNRAKILSVMMVVLQVTTASLLPMVLPNIPVWTVWVIRWFVLTMVVVKTNSQYLETHLHIFPCWEVSCVLHTLLSGLTHVFDIDKALLAGDFCALMEMTNMVTFESVLSNDVQSSYEKRSTLLCLLLPKNLCGFNNLQVTC